MPITKSAKKEQRASKKKKVFNLRNKRDLKISIKKIQKEGGESTKENIKALQKAVDKAVKNGVIKKNTGARKKSRFMKNRKV